LTTLSKEQHPFTVMDTKRSNKFQQTTSVNTIIVQDANCTTKW